MTEKSALDTLNEMYDMIKNLHAKVDLLNKNFNILHGKINKDKLENIELKFDLDSSQKKIGMGAQVVLAPESIITKVFGTVYSPDKQPIYGVVIKISDTNNKVIKSIRTNMHGKWETNLPPGKYSIKYIKDNMSPSYRLIEIKNDQKELEVL